MTYQQCKLKQNNATIVSWIESRGAKIGNKVELLEEEGLWDVISVGRWKLSKEALNLQESYHRSHRKGTDI